MGIFKKMFAVWFFLLTLVSASFSTIPTNIMKFDCKKTSNHCDLAGNGLTDSDLDGLRLNGYGNLQELSLLGNRITSIGENNVFDSMTSLTRLDLTGNNITKIHPNAFDKLTKLTHLMLTGNQLKNQLNPKLFVKLTQLKELQLGNNQLTSIPANSFKTLSNLEELWLTSNRLTLIDPFAFIGLGNLEKLMLGGNQLKKLDPIVFHLRKLDELRLDGNKLTKLEPHQFLGSSLRTLWLNRNSLTLIESKAFDSLDRLVELHLNENELTGIYEPIKVFGISQLPNLQLLWLSGNKMSRKNLIEIDKVTRGRLLNEITEEKQRQ